MLLAERIFLKMPPSNNEKERWRLARLYGQMSEGELEKLAEDAGSLSETAKSALKFEIAKRGLQVQLREHVPTERPQFSKPVVLRSYLALPDALLAKSILDSAGIECFLADQNIIRLDWFLSNALGGVKLLVREEDAAEAAAVLEKSATA